MALLKQSTAYTRTFKMVSSGDHFSLKTGASPVVNLSKAGAAFAAAGGAVTEVASGWYKVALNTTDTATLGDLAYYITGTGADDTDFVDQVADTANDFADALLSRNVSNVEATAAEHTLCTVILAQLENSISGATLTIKRTNGTTTHATKTLTTDAAAVPIIGIT